MQATQKHENKSNIKCLQVTTTVTQRLMQKKHIIIELVLSHG